MGWRVVVRASRYADPTSVRLSHRSAIVQTRERTTGRDGARIRALERPETRYFRKSAITKIADRLTSACLNRHTSMGYSSIQHSRLFLGYQPPTNYEPHLAKT